jgi:hypothetical protein
MFLRVIILYKYKGNKEHRFATYEALSHNSSIFKLNWVSDYNGLVPDGSVVGGHCPHNPKRDFFIGRVNHQNSILPGKIDPANRSIYVSSGNREFKYPFYQALTVFSIYDT